MFGALCALLPATSADAQEVASICPPGEYGRITHPDEDSTLLRCKPDYSEPIAVPAPRPARVVAPAQQRLASAPSPKKARPGHHWRHRSGGLEGLLEAIFSQHRR